MPRRSVAFAAVLAPKAALVGIALTVIALDRFEGLALVGRALAYPLVVFAVPLGWWFVRRRLRRPVEYPYLLDGIVVAPFLVDLGANVLGVPERAGWWPAASHLFNWTLLVVAFGLLVSRLRLGRLETAALAVGFGATTAIVWELAEYPTLHRTELERVTVYRDTLADLGTALAGSALGALLTVTVLWPRPRRSG